MLIIIIIINIILFYFIFIIIIIIIIIIIYKSYFHVYLKSSLVLQACYINIALAI